MAECYALHAAAGIALFHWGVLALQHSALFVSGQRLFAVSPACMLPCCDSVCLSSCQPACLSVCISILSVAALLHWNTAGIIFDLSELM